MRTVATCGSEQTATYEHSQEKESGRCLYTTRHDTARHESLQKMSQPQLSWLSSFTALAGWDTAGWMDERYRGAAAA
jgi:hypothetical protein